MNKRFKKQINTTYDCVISAANTKIGKNSLVLRLTGLEAMMMMSVIDETLLVKKNPILKDYPHNNVVYAVLLDVANKLNEVLKNHIAIHDAKDVENAKTGSV